MAQFVVLGLELRLTLISYNSHFFVFLHFFSARGLNPTIKSEVDALGVITISRECFERCSG